MSVSDSQKKATKKYRSNYYNIQIALNKKHDSDVIEHLDRIKNKRAYILGLIRDDIAMECLSEIPPNYTKYDV